VEIKLKDGGKMEWLQFIILLATIIGSAFAFYKVTHDRIDRMEEFHREDEKNTMICFLK
jgi:hypothetical protein